MTIAIFFRTPLVSTSIVEGAEGVFYVETGDGTQEGLVAYKRVTDLQEAWEEFDLQKGL